MISVIIPTYNYSAFELVINLQNQCEQLDIAYEIIVQDDGSSNSEFIEENELITKIPNCFFYKNENNLGRAKNRNSLIKKTKFNWVISIDCDTEPVNNDYVKKYLELTENTNTQVAYGGIEYKEHIPNSNEILRWEYGKKRETVTCELRKSEPYKYFLTSNIFFNKNLFEKIPFNEEITEYGYEDLVFVKELEKNNIGIAQIDNPVYHLNLETSEEFLKKTEKSLQTLLFLEENKFLRNDTTKLQKVYQKLKWWRLDKLYFKLFKKFKRTIVSNLLSKNPKIFYFDLYKLGYFIILKSKN